MFIHGMKTTEIMFSLSAVGVTSSPLLKDRGSSYLFRIMMKSLQMSVETFMV